MMELHLNVTIKSSPYLFTQPDLMFLAVFASEIHDDAISVAGTLSFEYFRRS
jgi:hypothetical protein